MEGARATGNGARLVRLVLAIGLGDELLQGGLPRGVLLTSALYLDKRETVDLYLAVMESLCVEALPTSSSVKAIRDGLRRPKRSAIAPAGGSASTSASETEKFIAPNHQSGLFRWSMIHSLK